jgi:transposase InsO family protein
LTEEGYASYAYTQRLQSMSIQISMSAKGHAYDNAKAESFLKNLIFPDFGRAPKHANLVAHKQ